MRPCVQASVLGKEKVSLLWSILVYILEENSCLWGWGEWVRVLQLTCGVSSPFHLCVGSGMKLRSGLPRKHHPPASPIRREWGGCGLSSCWVECFRMRIPPAGSGIPSSDSDVGVERGVALSDWHFPASSGSDRLCFTPVVLQLHPKTFEIPRSSCWTDTHYFTVSSLPLVTFFARKPTLPDTDGAVLPL